MQFASVAVGKKNVIAAGAVVTKDTPDYALMAGVPAMQKKTYKAGCRREIDVNTVAV